MVVVESVCGAGYRVNGTDGGKNEWSEWSEWSEGVSEYLK